MALPRGVRNAELLPDGAAATAGDRAAVCLSIVIRQPQTRLHCFKRTATCFEMDRH